MKTPQQIIDSLPEGNRKRACVILNDILVTGEQKAFWAVVNTAGFSAAAEYLVQISNGFKGPVVIADMIWEG